MVPIVVPRAPSAQILVGRGEERAWARLALSRTDCDRGRKIFWLLAASSWIASRPGRAPSEAVRMVPEPERRRMRRVLASVDVELASAGSLVAGHLEDISVLGLRMRASRSLPVGTCCQVRLRADGLCADIDARATIARVEDGFLALRFDELPYESYEHLRAFLLRRADDPSALDDELSDRMGFLSD